MSTGTNPGSATRLVAHTVVFELVTPAFVGGADAGSRDTEHGRMVPEARARQREDVGVRVRPIVGMWRYWFRALLGGAIGWLNPTDIANAEEAVFGGVRGRVREPDRPDRGQGGGQPASFRVALLDDTCTEKYQLDDRRNRDGEYARFGSYLCYGLDDQKEGPRGSRVIKTVARYALVPGSERTFSLRIVCSNNTWLVLQHVIAVWTLLGGLGARWRRGLGSLRLLSIDGEPIGTDGRDTAAGIVATLHLALGAFQRRYAVGARKIPEGQGAPPFDVVTPSCLDLRLVRREFQTYGDALAAIRSQMRVDVTNNQQGAWQGTTSRSGDSSGGTAEGPAPPDPHLGDSGWGWRQRWPEGQGDHWKPGKRGEYAYYVGCDHDVVHAVARPNLRAHSRGIPSSPKHARDSNITVLVRNAQFGLPIPFSGWGTVINLIDGSDKPLRRPSPLIFRVLRVAPHNYRVLVLLFGSRFTPLAPNGKPFRIQAQVVEKRSGKARVVHTAEVSPGETLSHLRGFLDACDADRIDFSNP